VPGIDEARYPRLHRYLAGLPAGEASHPDCLVRSSLCHALIEGMPGPAPDVAGVPPLIARILKNPPVQIWMPEVEVMALSLFIADRWQMTDAQAKQWLKRQNRSFFRSLMYRAVMAIVSPAALVPRAATRWSAVHRGSHLEARVIAPTQGEMVLRFPEHLYDRSLLYHFTAVFEAALENSNAMLGEVELVESDAVHGVYRFAWR